MGIGALADAYFRQTPPPDELLDPLKTIIRDTGESAYLGGWVHGELEVLAEMSGTRAVRVMDVKPGFTVRRMPAQPTRCCLISPIRATGPAIFPPTR